MGEIETELSTAAAEFSVDASPGAVSNLPDCGVAVNPSSQDMGALVMKRNLGKHLSIHYNQRLFFKTTDPVLMEHTERTLALKLSAHQGSPLSWKLLWALMEVIKGVPTRALGFASLMF